MANITGETDSIRSSLASLSVHHNDIMKTPVHRDSVELEQKIIREEKCLETCGGDSPQYPSVNKNGPNPSEESDIFRVSWDGPNDPDNPQNWSKPSKWLITILCCLLTINVYASSLFSIKVGD